MPLTRFEHDGFDATRAGRKPKSVCIAPIQGKNRNWSEKSDCSDMSQSASLEACYPVVVFHRIERGDYSYGMTASGLLPRASVEHGKRLSSHRRSTGTAHDRRLTLSPYPGWWPGLPGVLPDRKIVALRLRQLTTAEQRSATD